LFCEIANAPGRRTDDHCSCCNASGTFAGFVRRVRLGAEHEFEVAGDGIVEIWFTDPDDIKIEYAFVET
jgi:hypothetical protein